MPSTYNGIGTRYYGNKNIEQRQTSCPHCGAHVALKSYDTRLWFVVFFIPVIPLGRKRIVDQCPSCTRHFAVDADKWETSKQLEISGAQEKFRSAPSAETGMAVHQRLLQFHEFEQAAEFRRTLNDQFADNANLQAHLGAALAHFGKHAEAAPFFARALVLRPDLPEARVGVAAGHVRAGRLTEARELLDFLEKPGAGQLYSLEPLESLGRACQSAGHHEDALAIFARLYAELPTLSEHRGFRALVLKSEKAAGRKESLLPKLKFSWRRIFRSNGPDPHTKARTWLLLGAGAAIIVLGFAISNEYVRRHRTLHLVNVTGRPVTVQIDGTEVARDIRGIKPVTLSEGPHRAVLSGAVTQQVDFDVRSPYFERWFGDPAWVLNVGAAAVLLRTEVVYSQNPRPPSVSVHFGQTFEAFWRVTHPFRKLPDSVQVKAGQEETRSDLQLYTGESANLFTYFIRQNQIEQALGFAESWLQQHPDDEDLLRRYGSPPAAASARVEAFLRGGLAARPVRIEWHRTYQEIRRKPATQSALTAEYDGLLRKEPNNPSLLYLRGRLAVERPVARDYFERAVRIDPNHPYASYALGYERAINGDWIGARPFFADAVKLRPNDRGFETLWFECRLALGETAVIERETRQQLARDQTDALATLHLIDSLAVQGRREEAVKAAEAFGRAETGKYGADAQNEIALVHRYALYSTGNLPALEKAAMPEKSRAGRVLLAETFVEQGRPAEALRMAMVPEDPSEQAIFLLALSLAFHDAGDVSAADRQIAAARKVFAAGDEEMIRVAALLESVTPPPIGDVQNLALRPREKATLLAVLAQRHPALRAELAALARKLNVERVFPFHLIQRLTTATPQ